MSQIYQSTSGSWLLHWLTSALTHTHTHAPAHTVVCNASVSHSPDIYSCCCRVWIKSRIVAGNPASDLSETVNSVWRDETVFARTLYPEPLSWKNDWCVGVTQQWLSFPSGLWAELRAFNWIWSRRHRLRTHILPYRATKPHHTCLRQLLDSLLKVFRRLKCLPLFSVTHFWCSASFIKHLHSVYLLYRDCRFLPLLITLLCCFGNFCCHSQTPHPGRIEPAHNILQQHSSNVHGNQSLCETGSPLPQRNANTQSSRLQGEGSFGLGSAGAPGGEGADHALDVSRRVLSRCFKAMATFRKHIYVIFILDVSQRNIFQACSQT